MLWTCPKCQNENEESCLYCKYCGERKVGAKPIKTSHTRNHPSSPSSQTTSKIQYFTNAERTFSNQVEHMEFKGLETYATISAICGYAFTVLAVITFFVLWFKELGFLYSLLLSLIPASMGFSFLIVSEVINLFLHGQTNWYLTSKYTYVNSELTNELLNKIENLENQITKLSCKENESNN